jgi:endonuclease/exonuclease/phosphatase family metal-dependent hydrolase
MKNIDKICELIKRENPDIITLQEVDKPTALNGHVDEIKEIVSKIGYPYYFHGVHVDIGFGNVRFLKFGTAIISKFPLKNKKSIKFSVSFPAPKKGFVMVDVILPNLKKINLISVHTAAFDILHPEARKKQMDVLINSLKNKKIPTIVSGDINADFIGKEDTLRHLIKKLSLKAFKPKEKINTYHSLSPRHRLDWILLTKEFKFLKYEILKDKVSDHLAIYSEIELN